MHVPTAQPERSRLLASKWPRVVCRAGRTFNSLPLSSCHVYRYLPICYNDQIKPLFELSFASELKYFERSDGQSNPIPLFLLQSSSPAYSILSLRKHSVAANTAAGSQAVSLCACLVRAMHRCIRTFC